MRNLFICLLLIGCLLGSLDACAKEASATAVARKTQQAASEPSAGIKRFKLMYYYPVRNSFPEEAGWFSSPYKGMHIRALATYFFNMQVSSKLYHLSAEPSQLTLNFLGVLDGLVGAPQPFDMAQATSFYKKNKKEVDAHLTHLRAQSAIGKQWGTPSQAQINAWLKLLEKQPRHGKLATYLFPNYNFLQTAIPASVSSAFQSTLAQAINLSKKQVITYETAQASLEDLDSKHTVHSSHVKLTYRWVKDECYYATYVLAKLLAGKIANNSLNKATRLYVLTAYPKSGEFLQPSQGNRFTLANGSTSLHWRYHTALLVVFPHADSHVTLVLDSFLGGSSPISLDQWLSKFHVNTVFTAVPFLRNKKVESALQTPSKVIGTRVQVKGRTYEPHPVQ